MSVHSHVELKDRGLTADAGLYFQGNTFINAMDIICHVCPWCF